MPKLEWWRVLYTDNGKRHEIIICGACLHRRKWVMLNRVFGSSQTCAVCQATDKKG